MSVTIEMPYPYSANKTRVPAVVNGRARLISSSGYAAWLAAAVWEVAAQRPGKIVGKYRVTFVLTPPPGNRIDIDNALKSLNDVLVKAGVVQDDRLLQRLTVEWSSAAPVAGGRCVATVETAA